MSADRVGLHASIGKYRIIRELGRGGMGVVYLAEDTRLQREVALKILHPFLSMDEEFVRRFTSEARAIAALAHGGIVRVHAFEEVNGSHLIDMEYIEGGSLDKVLANGPCTPGQALAIALRVFESLAACHARGIVHRDIKPSNILMASDGRVLLSDFGLARSCALATAASATSSSFIGTPKYAAPESWGRTMPTPSGDVYSAGLVLLELLAGRTPFDGDSPLEIMRKAITLVDIPVRTMLPNISESLVGAIVAMLAADPAARPVDAGSALELLRETTEFAELPDDCAQTMRITPPEFRYRKTGPLKRGRGAVALLVALTALIGLAVYVQQPERAAVPQTAIVSANLPVNAPAAVTPGAELPSPEVNNVFAVGERVVFAATVGGWRSLWTYDLATKATEPLWPELTLEPEDDIHGLQPVNRGVVAVIRSPVNGFTLFRTDGTKGGTVSLAHAASWESNRIVLYASHRGWAYFCRVGGDNTYGIWKTDGTVEEMRHIWGGHDEAIFTGMGFTSSGGLFASSSTGRNVRYFPPGETTPVFLGHQPKVGIHADRMITLGERVLVESDDGNGAGRELWVGGKTPEEFQLLRDFMPGGKHGVVDVEFGRFKNEIVFTPETPEHGREPWLTDGTKEGTHLLSDINPGPLDSLPLRFVESGALLFFNAQDEKHGKELWVTDGTTAGTRMTRDIAPGWRSADPHSIRAFKGGVLFTAGDLEHGEELWFSDGTEAGTRLILDCMPGIEGRGTFGVEVVGERAFFSARHPAFGRVLWETDGTATGTRPLFERLKAQSPIPSEPAAWTNLSGRESIMTIATPEYGAEPWIVSEAFGVSTLVRDILPGPESSQPAEYLEFHGGVFFVADDGIHGRELWRYGGAPEHTSLRHDAWKGKDNGNPRELTIWPPNRFAFVAFNGDENQIFYIETDTTPVFQIPKPATIRCQWDPKNLRPGLENWLYFSNQTASGETTIWRTDGTKVERVAGLGRTTTP